MNIAIIPARGGSKRIPRKNIKLFHGKPMIAYSIEAAKKSGCFDKIIVSTDDQEIANYAASMGAEVIERPFELAGDTATSESALIHALHTLPEADSQAHLIFLQATSPIRLRASLDRAINQYLTNRCDSVVAVVPASPFLWTESGRVARPSYDIENRLRRQEFDAEDSCFRETGSLYITGRDSLLRTSNRISGRVSLFKMAEVEGVDIDTELDFQIAETLICGLKKSGDLAF